MPNVLLDMPQDLLDWIDDQVMNAKQEALRPAEISPAQRQEAIDIANSKGAAAANLYLRSLRPSHGRASRRAVIVELLELSRQLGSKASLVKEAPKPEEPSAQAPRGKFGPTSPKKPGTSAKRSAK